MTIREKVARAIYPANFSLAQVAITVFLEAAAEDGWHMRPDEADPEMYDAGEAALDAKNGHVGDAYRAMVTVAAEFEWDR